MIWILRLLINAAALMALPYLINGIQVESFYIAVVTAVILGLINISIKPLVHFLTLPLSVLTLGVFALIVNGLFFWFVASFIDGFAVAGFWPAFWGALVMTLVSWMTNQLLDTK